MTVEEIISEIIEVDDSARAEILYFLLDYDNGSDEADAGSSMSPDEHDEYWAAEIARRVDRFERGEAETVPMEQVYANARAKLAQRHREYAEKLSA